MIALTLMLHLALAVPAAPTPKPQDLPGDAFAIPSAPIVLHSGPSANHPGVLMIDQDDVLRIASPADASTATFVRVYVPQGYPVYVHGDFVHVDLARRTVTVEGTRLNLRLLPATEGLIPLGQLDDGVHELQLLDVEGDWVRVLAPLSLPLFARSDELAATAGSVGAQGWSERMSSRESRRGAQIAAFDATDPVRIRERRLEGRLSELKLVRLADLSDADLTARESTLVSLGRESERAETSSVVQALRNELDTERQRRAVALANLAEMERQRARDAANLVREARALDFGLRFLGKGDEVSLEGVVSRRSSEDSEAVVYSIQGPTGRSYKLSAAKEIANLRTLIGKRVALKGRSLSLVNVQGQVLIVDSIVSVSKP